MQKSQLLKENLS